MGILVDVNLKEKDGKNYLEIVTEAYPYPISFRGKYYQRSGATNQELKGAALDRFLLRKQGRTWDSVPVPYLKWQELDNVTLDQFRSYAKKSGRMDETDLLDNTQELLDKLRLFESNYLKRAAALLFHPDPEKYITGAFIKIGYFKADAD
ncbi:MAG: ATP-dependent DNA helicase, partial [Butyricimonas virosa]